MKEPMDPEGEPTRPAIEPLLRFLPRLEGSGVPIKGAMSSRPPRAISSEEADRFIQALYEHGWVTDFDWGAWQEVAVSYFNSPESLRGADIPTLQKLLTTHARKDRFIEGHMLEMLKSGHIALILRRLKELAGPDEES